MYEQHAKYACKYACMNVYCYKMILGPIGLDRSWRVLRLQGLFRSGKAATDQLGLGEGRVPTPYHRAM